jgi:Flp pilus assembly protein TadG
MARNKPSRKGSSMIEFTLVGIPMMFLLISIVEMSRGMWMYDTLAHSIKGATRFVITKGQNCSTSPNACAVTVQQVAQRIRDAGVGLDPAQLTVTLTSSSRTIGPSTLQALLADTQYWPTAAPGAASPDPGSAVGQPVTITASIPFRSGIAMFWPGGGGMNFTVVTLNATSRERIQF